MEKFLLLLVNLYIEFLFLPIVGRVDEYHLLTLFSIGKSS